MVVLDRVCPWGARRLLHALNISQEFLPSVPSPSLGFPPCGLSSTEPSALDLAVPAVGGGPLTDSDLKHQARVSAVTQAVPQVHVCRHRVLQQSQAFWQMLTNFGGSQLLISVSLCRVAWGTAWQRVLGFIWQDAGQTLTWVFDTRSDLSSYGFCGLLSVGAVSRMSQCFKYFGSAFQEQLQMILNLELRLL